MQPEGLFRFKVDVQKADLSGIGEIAERHIFANFARIDPVIGEINVSAVLFCNGTVDAADHPGGIHLASGPFIQVAGAGIGPGVQEIAFSFSVTMEGQDRTADLIVGDKDLKLRIGLLQISHRHAENAVPPGKLAFQLMGVLRDHGPVDVVPFPPHLYAAEVAEIAAVYQILRG